MGLISRKEDIEHIDTSVIIRLIVGDSSKNYQKAKKLLSKKNKIFVFEDAAMMEVAFVLSKVYKYPRERVAVGINFISSFDNICFNKGLIESALNLYLAHPKLSFVDCYLAATTNISGEVPLWTFDHKLAAQCPVAKEL